jgi:hypothetical protein
VSAYTDDPRVEWVSEAECRFTRYGQRWVVRLENGLWNSYANTRRWGPVENADPDVVIGEVLDGPRPEWMDASWPE